MTERYDVMTGRTYTDREGNEKTAWTRVGTMWPMRDKDGFSISFDALPVAQMKDGKIEVRAVCFPPREREEAPAPAQEQRPAGGSYANRRSPPPRDLDDEIPF